ncbi:FACT complex subunit [Borealophlyctis nickersoniae]|nr:FACT complex subunit [Borealophlyctis nickersoniae]
MGDRATTFDNIFLGGKARFEGIGRLKLAEAGLGWKNSQTGTVLTVSAADLHKLHWLRCARDFRLRIQKKDGDVLKFDGFPRDAYETLAPAVKSLYHISLESKDVSLKGWNWGTTEFSGPHMTFMVANRPAFEIPLHEVANTTQPSKNEVSVEFGSAELKDKTKIKEDFLTEIRFFVPGMATANQVGEGADGKKQLKDKEDALRSDQEKGKEDGEIAIEDEELALDAEGETISSASLLFETIKQKAEIDALQSEIIVTLLDLLCLTPRGRFEVDFHATFLRLRGKSHDHKILYTSIIKLFLLPKPDDLHYMFVIGLHPPLRQGNTRYPFLVFQFERDAEVETDVNLDEETLQTKYEGKLKKSYDGPVFEVVSEVLKGLSGKKLTIPGGTFRSAQGHSGIKCSYKANECFLYPLEKSFLSIPKPPIFIPHNEISHVTFARTGGASASTGLKTFEIKFSMTNGNEWGFSSIAKTEVEPLQAFFRNKKIKMEKDDAEEGPISYAEGSDIEDDEDDRRRGRGGFDGTIGAGDLDDEDESEDEDFVAESDSDVAEEFDENYASESDAGEDGGGGAGGGGGEKRPLKRSREPESGSESDAQSGSDSDRGASKKKKAKPSTSSSSSSKKPSKEKEPAKKKAKKDKDANAPKRPLTSYMLFQKEKRNEVVSGNPSMPVPEVSKRLGEMWKALSNEEKKRYEDMAKEAKEQYKVAIDEYEASGGGGGGSSSTTSKKATTTSKGKSSSSSSSKDKDTGGGSSKKKEVFKSAEFVDSDDDLSD